MLIVILLVAIAVLLILAAVNADRDLSSLEDKVNQIAVIRKFSVGLPHPEVRRNFMPWRWHLYRQVPVRA